MDEFKINTLSNEIQSLSYESKKKLYRSIFSVGYLSSNDLNDRLILISLLSLTYKKMKLKDEKITPLSILLKITGYIPDNSGFYYFLESLAILVEDFSYGIEKIDPCGMKTSKEIIEKIKSLLSTWLPF